MQTITISLKSFDSVYCAQAHSEISKILFYINQNYTKLKSNLSSLQEIEGFQETSSFGETNKSCYLFSYPKKKTAYTVIRSPHIDKKSREQFECNKYKNQIIVKNYNKSQALLLLFFFKNCRFTGVELRFSAEYSTFF